MSSIWRNWGIWSSSFTFFNCSASYPFNSATADAIATMIIELIKDSVISFSVKDDVVITNTDNSLTFTYQDGDKKAIIPLSFQNGTLSYQYTGNNSILKLFKLILNVSQTVIEKCPDSSSCL